MVIEWLVDKWFYEWFMVDKCCNDILKPVVEVNGSKLKKW